MRVGSRGVERYRRSRDQIEGPGDQKLALLMQFSPCVSVSPPVQRMSLVKDSLCGAEPWDCVCARVLPIPAEEE